MISSLCIRDFQCHDELTVELDPKITTIVGDSDVGKSSVIRALRWLCLNKPRGDGFVRQGSKRSTVSAEIDEMAVGRRKGKAENYYRIKEGKTSRLYKSFGSEVPSCIAEIVNLADENFDGQHDPPFWFGLTPGELAKEINKIVDLTAIDEVIAELISRINRSKTKKSVLGGRLEEAQVDVDYLAEVPKMDEELQEVEGLESEAIRIRTQGAVLGASVQEGIAQGERARRLQDGLQGARMALSLGSEWFEVSRRFGDLSDLVQGAEFAAEEAGRDVPDFGPLEDLKEAARRARNRFDVFRPVIRDVEGEERSIATYEDKIVEVEDIIEEETQGRCPLCGGELK